MKIAVVWNAEPREGTIKVINGKLKKLKSGSGGSVNGAGFSLPKGGRLEIELSGFTLEPGAFPTIITVADKTDPFSFNVRDVTSAAPIFLPEFGAAVLPADDPRDYTGVAQDVAGKRLWSEFDRTNSEPEESFENACAHSRDKPSPVWLGLGRDMRIFRIGPQEAYGYWGWVTPRYHSRPVLVPAGKEEAYPYQLCFEIGPGSHGCPNITRRLEAGVLPIVHSIQDEDSIRYHLTAFATLEKGPLKKHDVRGSEWHSAQMNTGFSMMTDQERLEATPVFERENVSCDNQVVCLIRI
ncbi:MAG: hypothetical protein GX608_13875, partial [Lentisphaerae bacterium]|nr:hypothetical protein [Lentisphaerota bacterium]